MHWSWKKKEKKKSSSMSKCIWLVRCTKNASLIGDQLCNTWIQFRNDCSSDVNDFFRISLIRIIFLARFFITSILTINVSIAHIFVRYTFSNFAFKLIKSITIGTIFAIAIKAVIRRISYILNWTWTWTLGLILISRTIPFLIADLIFRYAGAASTIEETKSITIGTI